MVLMLLRSPDPRWTGFFTLYLPDTPGSPEGKIGLPRANPITFTFHFHALEEEMATHSSVLAWRIPGMGEPGALPTPPHPAPVEEVEEGAGAGVKLLPPEA